MKWIDVNQRLPKKDGQYLVFFSGSVGIANYDHTKEIPFLYGGGSVKATHWAPLPQGPALDAVLHKKIDVSPTEWDKKWNDDGSAREKTFHFSMRG